MMGGPPEAIVQVDLLAGEGKGVGDSGGTVGVENSVLEAQQPAVQLQTISPPDLARVRAATAQFEQLDDPHLRGNNHWKKFLIPTFALAVVVLYWNWWSLGCENAWRDECLIVDYLGLVAWGSVLRLCCLLTPCCCNVAVCLSRLTLRWVGMVVGMVGQLVDALETCCDRCLRHVRTLPSDHVGEHSNLVVPPPP